jgi:hypothetical protein
VGNRLTHQSLIVVTPDNASRNVRFPTQTPQSLVQHVSPFQGVRDRHVKIKSP